MMNCKSSYWNASSSLLPVWYFTRSHDMLIPALFVVLHSQQSHESWKSLSLNSHVEPYLPNCCLVCLTSYVELQFQTQNLFHTLNISWLTASFQALTCLIQLTSCVELQVLELNLYIKHFTLNCKFQSLTFLILSGIYIEIQIPVPYLFDTLNLLTFNYTLGSTALTCLILSTISCWTVSSSPLILSMKSSFCSHWTAQPRMSNNTFLSSLKPTSGKQKSKKMNSSSFTGKGRGMRFTHHDFNPGDLTDQVAFINSLPLSSGEREFWQALGLRQLTMHGQYWNNWCQFSW